MKEPVDIKLPENCEDLLKCSGLFLLLAVFKWIEDDERPVPITAALDALPEKHSMNRTTHNRKGGPK
jgi:hypothetical protein